MNDSRDVHLQAARARAEALAQALEAAQSAAPPSLPASIAELLRGDGSLEAVEAEGLVEEALDWIRTRQGDAALRARLEPLAAKAKARRASRVHLDGDRAIARACYAKEGAALIFGTPEIQALFSEALRLEGLPLELDLGKRPRPIVICAPPLPHGVAGEAEWLEAQLKRSAQAPDLLERLNRRLPEGLRLLDWEELPAWATPVAELCASADWAWPFDDVEVEPKVAAFLASEVFFLEKVGKVEGQKQDKRLDLRPVVPRMAVEEGALRFTTLLGATAALNPLKVLGAILGREPETITGLRRVGFSMIEDARLQKGDRYTAKLKNMYEDAVLLGAAPHITLVDEDDDDPLVIE